MTRAQVITGKDADQNVRNHLAELQVWSPDGNLLATAGKKNRIAKLWESDGFLVRMPVPRGLGGNRYITVPAEVFG